MWFKTFIDDKVVYKQGVAEYVSDLWNLADWFTNGCFISWIILRFTSCYMVSLEKAAGLMSILSLVVFDYFWNRKRSLCTKRRMACIWPISHIRGFVWSRNDLKLPENCSNSFSKSPSWVFTDIFGKDGHGHHEVDRYSEYNISLVWKYISLFFEGLTVLVCFAFACGMNQLLWYYAELEKKQCDLDLNNTKVNPK